MAGRAEGASQMFGNLGELARELGAEERYESGELHESGQS